MPGGYGVIEGFHLPEQTPGGKNFNALTDDSTTDLGEANAFNSSWCEFEAIDSKKVWKAAPSILVETLSVVGAFESGIARVVKGVLIFIKTKKPEIGKKQNREKKEKEEHVSWKANDVKQQSNHNNAFAYESH